jgi:hypothetical protein
MHVLPHPVLERVIDASWSQLWTTRVGNIPIRELKLDSQVIGKFFQQLMTRELHRYDPKWRHPDAPAKKSDPDFVHEDPYHNFELKMSGQPGSRVYGNRCSSREFAAPRGSKHRDVWLLTINYTGETINLIRFGFVMGDDWIGQKAPTGNASRLSTGAYTTKLHVVRGDYQRSANAQVLRGVGKTDKTVGELASRGHPEALAFLAAEYYY